MLQTIDLTLLNEQDQRIDRYLRKQMSAAEASSFERDLRTDEGLRLRARFVAKTVQSLRNNVIEPDMIEASTPESAYRMVAKNPNITRRHQK